MGDTMSREEIKRLQHASHVLDLKDDARSMLFEQITQYAGQFLDGIGTAPAYSAPTEQSAFLKHAAITDAGVDIESVLDLLAQHVDSVGINTTSGRFLGYIPGGGLVYAGLGDFLAAIANRYASLYHASPGAVAIENSLLKWLGTILDYPESASGYLASGGSIANLTAIITARDAYGIVGDVIPHAVVYLTEHVHHCIGKAFHIAGLSQAIQRTVIVDDHYRMEPASLEALIEADKQAGLQPWMVIASAGTTNTGAVDPLQQIGEIATAHRLWFHIDGAYGGLFKLCPEGQAVLQGTEYSDSIVVDPHKTLFLPYGTGAVLIKDAGKQFAAFNAHADYIEFVHDNNELSAADLSPELTKHFRGLRLWLPLKLLGVQPFQAALSEKIALARYFYEQIKHVPGFEVGPYPDLSVATYRYMPARGNVNEYNQRLMEAVLREGEIYISSTRLDGQLMLRAAIMSFRTHLEDIDIALDRLGYHAQQLAKT
jgi:aromatic-L-amino-acid/L-tryptophan decarboxylase